MTLKNGSSEELRDALNRIRLRHDIPFWLLEKELRELGYPVSSATIYRFLKQGFPIPKKEKFLRKLASRLKQKYPEELVEKET